MEKILFIAHTQPDGSFPRIALETLSAAREMAEKLQAVLETAVIGGEPEPALNALAACGAKKFYAVGGKDLEAARYSTDIEAVFAAVKAASPTLIVAPATSRFSRMMAGVAQRAGGSIDTRVSGLDLTSGLKVQRWYYRQRMLATIARSKRPWFLLVESGIYPAWKGTPGTVSAEKVSVALTDQNKKTEVVRFEAASAGAQTLRPDAALLFVAGAGWTKKQADGQAHIKEAEKLILDMIQKSQASLGSSKSLVDQSTEGLEVLSFMSHLNQVGQTGTSPRHPKGLATCCHGEEPHVVGWRFIKERRAVNLDPNCGWAHGKADILYVADAFKVIEKVNALLGV
ncbi:MAG: electron transfer flavoprotein subunit alpha/FixB family protein [Candidatus Omnitrophota bacterium]